MPKISNIHDNIVTIKGKYNYRQDQFFKLSDSARGFVVSATTDEAKLLVIGDPSTIQGKSAVKTMKSDIEEVAVYDSYFGSIITPFGKIIHPQGLKAEKKLGTGMLDANPPALLDRIKVEEPLDTGMIAIDTMIPIGRGQRELIIGDRSTGKTMIALNTIINQKSSNVKVIYVAVGQKRNSVISSYNILKENNADKNTIIIFSNPDSSAQQFLAPKIGMAMAEALAYQGEDVLVVIDDLTKHANIYREISLSIGKNPGREAYPTDIFYQHSRLLERAGRFNEVYKKGSITCLPIVETIQGDVASLIPSNVISITDGQIFTSSDMFNNGEFPAINIGLSVSRTGSSVQSKMIRKASDGLKASYSSLFDIKKFADMSIDISEELQGKIEDWHAINNVLIQYGNKGYTRVQMVILTELFKMKALGQLIEKRKFADVFKKYCQENEGAQKVIKDINAGKLDDPTALRNALKAVFVPLTKIASGIQTDIISQKEYEALKGGK